MECMIEIENLSLTMKKQIILSDINLTFEKGKIHGLIGRNGSGKNNAYEVYSWIYQTVAGNDMGGP